MREKSVLPWVPAILAVVALIVFTTITIVRLAPGHSRPDALPPPEPAFSLPGTTSGPQVPVSLLPSPGSEAGGAGEASGAGDKSEASGGGEAGSAPTTPTRPTGGTPPPTAGPTRTTPPPAVTGSYRVLDSYADNFIGEVLLRNSTGAPQNWVVTVTYPGDLRTSWLESLPQPTLVRRGTTYTWTSSVPLAAGSTGPMRFQFDLVGGTDRPSTCEVNGRACA